MNWDYQKMDETGKIIHCPTNDTNGSVTGRIVFNVKAWFDENPEERKRLGWIKILIPNRDEIQYDEQTQYLMATTREIDEYTMEEVYHVMNKSPEMLRLEELMQYNSAWAAGGIRFYEGR